MDTCQICKNDLIDIKIVLRAKMRVGPENLPMSMYRYEGWCPSCEIYLTKRRMGKEEGDWETSHIKLEELDKELSKAEIKALYLRMEKEYLDEEDLFMKKKWNRLVSTMKETDQLYSFLKEDTSSKNELWISKGYVIKRGTHLINPFVEDVEESTTMLLIKNKKDYLS